MQSQGRTYGGVNVRRALRDRGRGLGLDVGVASNVNYSVPGVASFFSHMQKTMSCDSRGCLCCRIMRDDAMRYNAAVVAAGFQYCIICFCPSALVCLGLPWFAARVCWTGKQDPRTHPVRRTGPAVIEEWIAIQTKCLGSGPSASSVRMDVVLCRPWESLTCYGV